MCFCSTFQAACGLSKKPKQQIVDIDAGDVDNELAVVEYVEDIYNFYKLAEVKKFLQSIYMYMFLLEYNMLIWCVL